LTEEREMADIFELFRKISSGDDTKKSPITHIIVGLGNPGDKYYSTRHNAGFLAIDYISQKYSIKVDRVKYKAICGEGTIAGKGVLLMKPQTMMNLSGEAVSAAAAFYKIPPENIIVICDDVNFDVGKLRLRAKGSDGGQKGVRSITGLLGTEGFPRIKIGVGKKLYRLGLRRVHIAHVDIFLERALTKLVNEGLCRLFEPLVSDRNTNYNTARVEVII
jgi:PTH1 family peptidyl-tRNA hydrolase